MASLTFDLAELINLAASAAADVGTQPIQDRLNDAAFRRALKRELTRTIKETPRLTRNHRRRLTKTIRKQEYIELLCDPLSPPPSSLIDTLTRLETDLGAQTTQHIEKRLRDAALTVFNLSLNAQRRLEFRHLNRIDTNVTQILQNTNPPKPLPRIPWLHDVATFSQLLTKSLDVPPTVHSQHLPQLATLLLGVLEEQSRPLSDDLQRSLLDALANHPTSPPLYATPSSCSADALARLLTHLRDVEAVLRQDCPTLQPLYQILIQCTGCSPADHLSTWNAVQSPSSTLDEAFLDRIHLLSDRDPFSDLVSCLARPPWAVQNPYELARTLISIAIDPALYPDEACQEIASTLTDASYAPTSLLALDRHDVEPHAVQKPTTPSPIFDGPLLHHLRAGELAPTSDLADVVSAVWTFANQSHQRFPVFWITGPSGSRKSVTLLRLLGTLNRTPGTSVFLASDLGFSIADNGLAALLTDQRRVTFVGLDDPGFRGQTASWIDLRTAWTPTLHALASVRLPVLLCCGPIEALNKLRQDWPTTNVEVHTIQPTTESTYRELNAWALTRSGKGLIPYQAHLLPSDYFFQWSEGQTLDGFAQRLKDRLRLASSELWPFVLHILAVGRLGVSLDTAFATTLRDDARDALSRLVDDGLIDKSVSGFRFRYHIRTQRELYDTWFPPSDTMNVRCGHLAAVIDSAQSLPTLTLDFRRRLADALLLLVSTNTDILQPHLAVRVLTQIYNSMSTVVDSIDDRSIRTWVACRDILSQVNSLAWNSLDVAVARLDSHAWTQAAYHELFSYASSRHSGDRLRSKAWEALWSLDDSSWVDALASLDLSAQSSDSLATILDRAATIATDASAATVTRILALGLTPDIAANVQASATSLLSSSKVSSTHAIALARQCVAHGIDILPEIGQFLSRGLTLAQASIFNALDRHHPTLPWNLTQRTFNWALQFPSSPSASYGLSMILHHHLLKTRPLNCIKHDMEAIGIHLNAVGDECSDDLRSQLTSVLVDSRYLILRKWALFHIPPFLIHKWNLANPVLAWLQDRSTWTWKAWPTAFSHILDIPDLANTIERRPSDIAALGYNYFVSSVRNLEAPLGPFVRDILLRVGDAEREHFAQTVFDWLQEHPNDPAWGFVGHALPKAWPSNIRVVARALLDACDTVRYPAPSYILNALHDVALPDDIRSAVISKVRSLLKTPIPGWGHILQTYQDAFTPQEQYSLGAPLLAADQTDSRWVANLVLILSQMGSTEAGRLAAKWIQRQGNGIGVAGLWRWIVEDPDRLDIAQDPCYRSAIRAWLREHPDSFAWNPLWRLMFVSQPDDRDLLTCIPLERWPEWRRRERVHMLAKTIVEACTDKDETLHEVQVLLAGPFPTGPSNDLLGIVWYDIMKYWPTRAMWQAGVERLASLNDFLFPRVWSRLWKSQSCIPGLSSDDYVKLSDSGRTWATGHPNDPLSSAVLDSIFSDVDTSSG